MTGNRGRNPFTGVPPMATISDHEGRTTMTMRSVPINANDEERQTFDGIREVMMMGFKGSLDRLDEYLANQA
jgi:hypothetical protein